MTTIEEKNKNKVKNPEPPDSGNFTEVWAWKIIDFELGRKTLDKAGSEKAQTSARLAECSRSGGRLHDDWLEFLLTIGMFFALFLGLYGGLVEVWRFCASNPPLADSSLIPVERLKEPLVQAGAIRRNFSQAVKKSFK